MLDSILHCLFAHESISGKEDTTTLNKPTKQTSQETTFTREADVEGWVFLAEERRSELDSKRRSYADVVAGKM
ncbi:hypothetical protein DD237_001874 [Peronospora effusa]|uniref:Uncharacterized protein n=1 Tax=Peronospora effusa TaxID=542832 RepID=A0A425CLZ8_9STRA|nr:hypothetical protein DD237_001874 [Peronospora effusa]